MHNNSYLTINNITKKYPGVVALDDVSLCFKKGEIHAIVGENGAGKSTLIKTITGAIRPDKGEIIFEDKRFEYLNPHLAINLGIAAIYQEFNLIKYISVADNIFFGREKSNGIFLNKKNMNRECQEILDSFHIKLSPKEIVKNLGVAHQQLVEISKAVSQNANILIMDEPTAPLTESEIKVMFEVVKKLKEKGVTIIYISHRLEEIFAICDRVSVMRDGKHILTKNVKDTNVNELISNMVGREVSDIYPKREIKKDQKTILEVNNLTNKKVKNVSFKLKTGEILGIGGLVGSGRTELAMALFGADSIDSGRIIFKDKQIFNKSPLDSLKNGIGLLPEDRKSHGVLLEMSVCDNITFSNLDNISSLSFINKKIEKKIVEEKIKELSIKTPFISQKAKNLSGGNQQKVILAKWLTTKSEILIFDEPTRGIDVGAKQEIYFIMKELIKQGKSIIMISSEMPELLGVSDRILVMKDGKITGELNAVEASEEKILKLASGN